jgi:transposase-like protein
VGGIERGTRKCFMEVVPDRSANTLNHVIKKWILPGSRIITDGWQGYNELENLDGGIYQHDVVVHEYNFVNPNDADVHTQSIESTWNRMKSTLKRMRGTSADLFPSYLAEFLWRESVQDLDTFSCFLCEVIRQYPL